MKNVLTRLLVLLPVMAIFAASALAGVEVIEIQKIQVAKAMSGVVSDPSGAPIAGATVAEVSADRKTVIQSTITDANGNFTLPRTHKNKVYHLMVSMKNFNPLVVHVKVSARTSKLLNLQLYVAT